MTQRLVQVSFRWIKAMPEVKNLELIVKSVCDDWFRLNVYCWYLWTTKNPTEVYAGLSRIVKDEDGIVAIGIDPTVHPYGWAPQSFWDWLNPKLLQQTGLINLPRASGD
jgi:hypothetical protein